MNKKYISSILAVMVLFLVGCETTKEVGEGRVKSDSAQLKLAKADAERFANNILMGLKKSDYNLFVKNLKA
jgi:hypothetical protein